MQNKCSYTAPEAIYPACVSLNERDGFYYLSVRGVRKINGDAGDTIEVPIPRAELRKLSDALRDDRAIGEPVSIEDAVLPTIWKFNQTLKMLRMSRPKVERLLANPDSGFPKPFWIGSERYFLADAVRSWMLARIAEQKVADRHVA